MRVRRHARHFFDRPPLWSWRGLLRAAGDPLVQSWGLVLICFMALLHYGGGTAGREQKNKAGSVLLAGVAGWGERENAAHSAGGLPRPRITLEAGVMNPVNSRSSSKSSLPPDLASGAKSRAAASGSWRHLPVNLRERIAGSFRPADGTGQVEVRWSGSARGNAGGIAWHRSRVRQGAGAAPQFVIGNGTHSGDGEIEITGLSAANGPGAGAILICLIGAGELTPGQSAALGELLVWLEARCGALQMTECQ